MIYTYIRHSSVQFYILICNLQQLIVKVAVTQPRIRNVSRMPPIVFIKLLLRQFIAHMNLPFELLTKRQKQIYTLMTT